MIGGPGFGWVGPETGGSPADRSAKETRCSNRITRREIDDEVAVAVGRKPSRRLSGPLVLSRVLSPTCNLT